MSALTATYSPEDNKLRLYSLHRLDNETYQRVRDAGFKFAPKQDLFVAPMWTPDRADLLLELCGEIGDEDTSLVDRAEERADRFEEYHDKRSADAARAHALVDDLTEHMPLGQPILVGHHSERGARKHAEKITNAMRRAVGMWDTAKYWQARAAGALRHAKYKERNDVRARRIRTLEADLRKQLRIRDEALKFNALWEHDGLTLEKAKAIANLDHVSVRVEGRGYEWSSLWSELDKGTMTVEEAAERAAKAHGRTIARAARWIAHLDLRLGYERAMLAEAGGLAVAGTTIEIGGRVQIGGEWLTVLKVNKVGDQVRSVTTNARFVRVRGVEEITAYEAPSAETTAKVKEARKLPPLVNFAGEGFLHMTSDEYKRINQDFKSVRVVPATNLHGNYRQRTAMREYRVSPVFLTDAKAVDRPVLAAAAPSPIAAPERVPLPAPSPRPVQEPSAYDAIRDQLKAGVSVAVAPQLYPTPAPLATRMADLAELSDGLRVLEPSAGTGVIAAAIADAAPDADIVAVELHGSLANRLRAEFQDVRGGDFLAMTAAELGQFDRVLMNPPFENGADIKHIEHAFSMLKPGGVLVAICANGPRQNDRLRPLAETSGGTWEVLPPDTFKAAGTGVRTALLTLRAAP